MLDVTPTVVVTSAVDWPAIAASISTGVAALAGIGGTVWVARRSWNREDKRARIAEKRRIYASCLSALNTGLTASIRKQALQGSGSADIAQADREYTDAVVAAQTAVAELSLIAPFDVAAPASAALYNLLVAGDDARNSLTQAMNTLTAAMRVDLGEDLPSAPVTGPPALETQAAASEQATQN